MKIKINTVKILKDKSQWTKLYSNTVRRTQLRTLARESIENIKISVDELRNNDYKTYK
jgi:hypothetical protein